MKASADDYATFNHFSRRLATEGADPQFEWQQVKNIFMLLQEWFEDRSLYHLVGFLVWAGTDLNELRRLAAGRPKHELKERLRTKAVESAFRAAPTNTDNPETLRQWIGDRLENLEYPRDRRNESAPSSYFSIWQVFSSIQLLMFGFSSRASKRPNGTSNMFVLLLQIRRGVIQDRLVGSTIALPTWNSPITRKTYRRRFANSSPFGARSPNSL